MKKVIPLLICIFVFAQTSIAAGNQQIKYRIQCATSSDKHLMDLVQDIPELKTFTMPTGGKIYFSGGYFNKYESAKSRLEEVQSNGFKSAFIRVFKYNNMLSKPVGDSYIENAKKKIAIEKLAEKNKPQTTVSKTTSSTQKLYTRAEIDAMKKKAEARKLKAEKVEKVAVVTKDKKELKAPVEDLPIKEEKEKKEKPAFKIDEPPVYKILLGKSTGKNDQFEAVSSLNNEIIYTYENRNEIIYAIGFYGNEAAAKKSLTKYKKVAPQAEIIGLFKGKVISLKLANQLYEQFNAQDN